MRLAGQAQVNSPAQASSNLRTSTTEPQQRDRTLTEQGNPNLTHILSTRWNQRLLRLQHDVTRSAECSVTAHINPPQGNNKVYRHTRDPAVGSRSALSGGGTSTRGCRTDPFRGPGINAGKCQDRSSTAIYPWCPPAGPRCHPPRNIDPRQDLEAAA